MRGRLLNAYMICPTFAYFKFHFPEPPTFSMEEGKELDVREVLERFVKTEGCTVKYQTRLEGSLGSGIADAVLVCEGRVEIVEVKLGSGFYKPQLLQAAFYCMLAEEVFGKPCARVWLCSPEGCISKKFSESLRSAVKGLLEGLERDLEIMPRGKPSRYCSYCKYSGMCPWAKNTS